MSSFSTFLRRLRTRRPHRPHRGHSEIAPSIQALEDRTLLSTISGQKFNDLNGNGARDPGEPGLDGWTVQLLDETGFELLGTTVTTSQDLNGDQQIDPGNRAGPLLL